MKHISRLILILFIIYCCIEITFAYNENDYLKKETKYYYQEMTAEEQNIYDNILKGVVSLKEEIEINCNSERQLYEILMKFRADFPEIFWLKESYKYESNNENKIIKIIFNYVYSQEEIDSINETITNTINKLKEKTKDFSDYEKAREIFDYTCETITYNKETFNSVNVDQAFLKGDAICGGYAKMYCILANGIGLPCKMVIGCRKLDADVGHSWNEVYIENRTVFVDCTWGDHSQERETSNTYFDSNHETFLKNHIETIL